MQLLPEPVGFLFRFFHEIASLILRMRVAGLKKSIIICQHPILHYEHVIYISLCKISYSLSIMLKSSRLDRVGIR